MAKARNRVIAGDYQGKLVGGSLGGAFISLALTKFLYLNKETVETVVPLDDDSQISVTSAAMRGIVGELLLGPCRAHRGSNCQEEWHPRCGSRIQGWQAKRSRSRRQEVPHHRPIVLLENHGSPLAANLSTGNDPSPTGRFRLRIPRCQIGTVDLNWHFSRNIEI